LLLFAQAVPPLPWRCTPAAVLQTSPTCRPPRRSLSEWWPKRCRCCRSQHAEAVLVRGPRSRPPWRL